MTQRFSWLLPSAVAGLALLSAAPASAHHLMGLFHQDQPTVLAGLLSGLGHPLLGPDHLLFLLSLGLVGLQRSSRWIVGLLAVGLLGSAIGLILPALPGAEVLVALTLVVVGLVITGRLSERLLVPCFALHGYVLSASVIGWEPSPIGAYLVGLLLSQSALLILSLAGLRRLAVRLEPSTRKLLAGVLIGAGAAFGWGLLVA